MNKERRLAMERRRAAPPPVYSAENPDTSLSSAFTHAFDQPLENMATTFQALGMKEWETFMRDLIEEPEHYEAAAGRFINAQDKGFKWEYFPRAVFEQAGQIAGSIATRVGGGAAGSFVGGPVGMAVGALLGPTLFEAVQIAGPVAMERASRADPPRAEPNWEDWSGALGTAAASGVLNAIGIKNVGVLNNIGKGALKQAGKQIVKGGVSEGITEGLQGLTEQIGGTARTAQGLEIDPKAAVGEGFLGLGAGTGTQIGTEIVQDARTRDMQEGFFDMFKKKEGTETEYVPPKVISDEEVQAQVEKVEAERKALAEKDFPSLSKLVEPVEIDLFDSVLERTTDGRASSFDLEAHIPDIQSAIRSAGIKEEDVKDFTRDVLDEVTTHPEGYLFDEGMLISELGESGAAEHDVFDIQAMVDFVGGRAVGYYEGVQSTSPGKYEGIIEEGPGELTNKLPPVSTTQVGVRPFYDFQPPVGSVQTVYTPETANFLENSPKGPIDPTFMSHSPLWEHLQNVPKKPISAKKMMDELFVQVKPGTGALEHGIFSVSERGKGQKQNLAREVIESGVASFLLDRGESPVTRDEVYQVLQDHRSNYGAILLSDSYRGREIQDTEEESQIKEDLNTSNPQRLSENYLDEVERGVLIPEQSFGENGLDAWTQGKFNEFMEEEVKKSSVLPENYLQTPTPTSLLPNGEDRFYNEFVDVVEPKVFKRTKEYIEKELPAVAPFAVPQDLDRRATEWYGVKYGGKTPMQTFDMFTGKGTPELQRLGENMEVVLKYDARVDKVLERKALDDMAKDPVFDVLNPTSAFTVLARNKEQKYGDPDYYSKNDSTHHWTGPGTVGWTRGGMFSHGEGFKGYLMGEIQSKLGGAVEAQGRTYRSKVGNKMTPDQKRAHQKGAKFINLYSEYRSGTGTGAGYKMNLMVQGLFPDLKAEALPGLTQELTGKTQDSYPVGVPYHPDDLAVQVFGRAKTVSSNAKSYEEARTVLEQVKEAYHKPYEKKELVDLLLPASSFRSIGVDLTEQQAKTLANDTVEGLTTPAFSLVKMGLLDRADTTDPDVEAVINQYMMFYEGDAVNSIKNKSAQKYRKETLKAIRPQLLEMMLGDPQLGAAYTAIKRGDLPDAYEYQLLNKLSKTEGSTESEIDPDYPLKKGFAKAMVQATIVKTLMHDPDVTHLYIPTDSAGGGPTSPYKQAISEARKIAKQFDLEFKKVLDVDFQAQDQDGDYGVTVETNVPVFSLEIAPLREKIIRDGGFIGGYMKGGLVKKATNEVINYGDYGRAFI